MKSIYGLVGSSLGHSISPFVHSLFADYSYELMPMGEQEFVELMSTREFSGINVTIPYKKLAFSLCDELTPRALSVGCVNTVVNKNGVLLGDNTDYAGFCFALRRAGISLGQKKVLVLGSGGTSLTVRAVARDMGASETAVVSRSGEINYQNLYRLCPDTEVIINTTPVGMYPDVFGCPVELDGFLKLRSVADAVYNPLNTELVQKAIQKGLCATGGLPMLVAQAAYACGAFLQKEFSEQEIEAAVQRTYCEMTNLVLVGMPGCGKSRIGKSAAKLRGREFFDTDKLVEGKTGEKISKTMEKKGEPEFRLLEKQAVLEASCGLGRVISTGGGAVLDPDNIKALKKNGVILYLDRDIKKLSTKGRPLSAVHGLEKLKEQREPIYASCSDYCIKNNKNATLVAEKVWEGFDEAVGHQRSES